MMRAIVMGARYVARIFVNIYSVGSLAQLSELWGRVHVFRFFRVAGRLLFSAGSMNQYMRPLTQWRRAYVGGGGECTGDMSANMNYGLKFRYIFLFCLCGLSRCCASFRFPVFH